MAEYVKVRISESERFMLEEMIRSGEATTLSGAIRALAFSGNRRDDILREHMRVCADAYNDFKAVILARKEIAQTEDQEERLGLMETNIAVMERELYALIEACAVFRQETRQVI